MAQYLSEQTKVGGVAAYGQKTPKKKHVEEEGKIRKGEKVKGERRRELLPILSFKIF
jgi:hypothetical protein